jgi:ABC-2 type transport system ATP-binding protein
MGQRLGIAAALLADPHTIMLDEPVNGLDPEGVLWIRNLLTGLAAEGRTVLVSSHLMSEMALTATDLIVVGRGRLLADTTVERLVSEAGGNSVKVVSSDPARLRELLLGPDIEVFGSPGTETLKVTGLAARAIGIEAARAGIEIYELTPQTVSLEQAFMALTGDSVEYHGLTAAPDSATASAPATPVRSAA